MQYGWRSTIHLVCDFAGKPEKREQTVCRRRGDVEHELDGKVLASSAGSEDPSACAGNGGHETLIDRCSQSSLPSPVLNIPTLEWARHQVVVPAREADSCTCGYVRKSRHAVELGNHAEEQVTLPSKIPSSLPVDKNRPTRVVHESSSPQYPLPSSENCSWVAQIAPSCPLEKGEPHDKHLIRVVHVTRLKKSQESDLQNLRQHVSRGIRRNFWRWRQGFVIMLPFQTQSGGSGPGGCSASTKDLPMAIDWAQRVSPSKHKFSLPEGKGPAMNDRIVWRCCKDFIELRAQLQRKYPACMIPALPPIPLWFTLYELVAADTVWRLERSLARFLEGIREHPILGSDPLFESFIGYPRHLLSLNTVKESPLADSVEAPSNEQAVQSQSSCLFGRFPSLASTGAFLWECRPVHLCGALMRLQWRYKLRIDEWFTAAILHPIQRPAWAERVSSRDLTSSRSEESTDALDTLLEEWAQVLSSLHAQLEKCEQSVRLANRHSNALVENMVQLQRLEGSYSADGSRMHQGHTMATSRSCSTTRMPQQELLSYLTRSIKADWLLVSGIDGNTDQQTSTLTQTRLDEDPLPSASKSPIRTHLNDWAVEKAALFGEARRALRTVWSSRERYLYAVDRLERHQKWVEYARFPASGSTDRQQIGNPLPGCGDIAGTVGIRNRSGQGRENASAKRVKDHTAKIAVTIEMAKKELEDARNRYKQDAQLFYRDLSCLLQDTSRETAEMLNAAAPFMRMER